MAAVQATGNVGAQAQAQAPQAPAVLQTREIRLNPPTVFGEE